MKINNRSFRIVKTLTQKKKKKEGKKGFPLVLALCEIPLVLAHILCEN